MRVAESLSCWSEQWATTMWTSLLETSLALAIVAAVWALLRRWASPQLGYCLFLLVLAKAAVPFHVKLPHELARFWPEPIALRVIERVRVGSPAEREMSSPPSGARGPQLSDPDEPFASPASAASAAEDGPRAMASPSFGTMSLMMMGWVVIVTWLVATFLRAQWRTAVVLRESKPIDPMDMPVDWARLRRSAGVRAIVGLATSPAVASPVVHGFLRPKLVLPPGFFGTFTTNQARWVLLHELAHIRRRDIWVVAAQRLLQAIYFFNPALWLANWAIDRLREYACDDHASSSCRESRHECGQGFLATIARAIRNSSVPSWPATFVTPF